MVKPMLDQYGLSGVNLDQLASDYNHFVDAEKSKRNQKAHKSNLSFILALFTWFCPYAGIILIIQILLKLLFGYDTIPYDGKTLLGYVVYIILGSIYCLKWGKSAEDTNTTKYGYPDLSKFHRKAEWDNLQKYKNACTAYEEWIKKCQREFWEKLTGLQFEEEVANLYSRLGYTAIKTRASNDGGVDVILSKGREKIAVQCKAHNKKISPSVARDLYGVLNSDNYTRGIIVTLCGASANTLDFCKGCINKPITILDVNDLISMQKA